MIETIRRLMKDNSGATAIEYALVAALMSVVVVAALKSMGLGLNNRFSNVQAALN